MIQRGRKSVDALLAAVPEPPERKPVDAPPSPRHLSEDAGRLWASILAEFDLDAPHLTLLQLACEAYDRCQDARRRIEIDGAVIEGANGAPRANPAVAIERDSRIAFARLLRELDLDGGEVAFDRPPPLRSNRN